MVRRNGSSLEYDYSSSPEYHNGDYVHGLNVNSNVESTGFFADVYINAPYSSFYYDSGGSYSVSESDLDPGSYSSPILSASAVSLDSTTYLSVNTNVEINGSYYSTSIPSVKSGDQIDIGGTIYVDADGNNSHYDSAILFLLSRMANVSGSPTFSDSGYVQASFSFMMTMVVCCMTALSLHFRIRVPPHLLILLTTSKYEPMLSTLTIRMHIPLQ